MVVRATFIFSTIGALTSLVCAIWLWIWTETHGERDTYTIFQMIDLFADNGIDEYWHFNGTASTVLLSVLFGGLMIAFIVLVYNIKTYYKSKMSKEMRWLSILFAVFSISYGLRTAY